ncbi:hypothetical protein COV06_02260 [Candidatus Uhrbacteria bacterium CG10_big_fil_rev_8_21_14_0_10_50_16]|uniref:DUF11 domain-containing protein n=1 Tax=Candidatus Uhrbacteria bacterium CG10_big_fil_rev_8_21_14_0_10_50_16 TaxID=1975039 RepID=A0A2H0RPJ3_9BACT|nr:MAG: hypothetical protein COV06_02260 [Candidatus Uhrbacteria bacterium CG10_big_fil_rev_8_21_14_0_10_50_16]
MSAPHKNSLIHLARTGVHVARQPGRLLSVPLAKRLEKHGWKHRLLDIGTMSALVLLSLGIAFTLFRSDPGTHVLLTSVVAPTEVVSGGDSTLAISYTNESGKLLKDVTLTLAYPPYFVLQTVDHPAFHLDTNTIEIGDLAPGANGLIKIHGVMFGDVGGEQTFSTTLGYGWDGNRTGSRVQTYRFMPQRSALTIDSQLPDRLVSGQRLSGSITLQNTGSLTFPEAAIHASFPNNFTLTSTSLKQRKDTTWIVPTIEPNEELVIIYTGSLALNTNEEATFTFEPSFVFGDERFAQDTLSETVSTVPPPIAVSIDPIKSALTSGKEVTVTVRWGDQTDLGIERVKLHIEGAVNQPEWTLDTPVQAGSRTVNLVPHAGSGTNRQVTFTPIVDFVLNETQEPVSVIGEPTTGLLTTSVVLGGFARYFTSAGDQLGRGPLPPRANEATIYWAFLNVQDTFNDLTDVVVTADLANNVTWVNRQSVTKGAGVISNGTSLSWNVGTLPATISNGTVAAASFALSITPSNAQIGTVPALLSNVRITGHDVWTGQTITKTINTITTQTESDSGRVEH